MKTIVFLIVIIMFSCRFHSNTEDDITVVKHADDAPQIKESLLKAEDVQQEDLNEEGWCFAEHEGETVIVYFVGGKKYYFVNGEGYEL